MTRKHVGMLMASALVLSLGAGSVQALEGVDGTDYFSEIPRLVETEEGDTEANQYIEMTIEVPETETVGLRALVIEQEQNPQDLDITAEDVVAVVGEDYSEGAASLPLDVSFATVNDREQIRILFQRSVQPGTTISLRIDPAGTQELNGAYLFGVSALPQGDRPRDYFLGFARANFAIESSDG